MDGGDLAQLWPVVVRSAGESDFVALKPSSTVRARARLSSPGRTVRQLLFGRKRTVYRVYFTIINDVVIVLHIRHGARREPRRL